MPFFDFKCRECGHEFNIRISNQDKDKVRCPQCGTGQVRQMLSPFFTPGSGKGTPGKRERLPDGCAGCNQAGMG